MKRSAGVTLSGVVVLIGCAFVILVGVSMLAGLFLVDFSKISAESPGAAAMPPRFMAAVLVFSAFFEFGFATWGITSAVGLFRLRAWARTSMLVFSGLLVAFSLMGVPFLLAMPVQPGTPESVARVTRIFMSVFYLSLAMLGAFWLYFFNRTSVKKQFLGESVGGLPGAFPVAAGAAPRRPLSITIIAWWLLFVAASTPVSLFVRIPVILFTFVLTGWKAVLVYSAYAVVHLYLGIGLLRLRPLSRMLAVYLFVFNLVVALVNVFAPGRDARLSAVVNAMRLRFGVVARPPVMPPLWFILTISFVFATLPLWFLITRKDAFLTSGAARPQN